MYSFSDGRDRTPRPEMAIQAKKKLTVATDPTGEAPPAVPGQGLSGHQRAWQVGPGCGLQGDEGERQSIQVRLRPAMGSSGKSLPPGSQLLLCKMQSWEALIPEVPVTIFGS